MAGVEVEKVGFELLVGGVSVEEVGVEDHEWSSSDCRLRRLEDAAMSMLYRHRLRKCMTHLET